ncbi:uncharacterized protein pdgfbb [Lampris incognitus]|uniref:uncharacterized protein pdgfbb n=1 Tax=Lampris incognitus TaxID=2546036 RepID=UPI0024B5C6BB|nr:uncharacterized protein pdgfbb [Lampris incognitus]
MSSWVQLLALLAACLRSAAEGDPLPAALVELVRSSPISSIEELQLLLLTDSVGEEEEESSPASGGGHRLPRSLDAQPAQQALCKIRTEVVEITRAMLDRSNANFLLWPPCVEVQRCSGCCNTKSLHCVPVLTHTRYLQVMKIQYINKRPTYAKAVVSVVDHVECRCQLAPRPPVVKKKTPRRQHGHNKDQHRNQTFSQGQGQGKAISKEELHRHDDLKQNQNIHLEELLEQHWGPRGDTFTQLGEGYSLAGEDVLRSGETAVYAPHWIHNATRLLSSENQGDVEETKDVKISDGNRTSVNVAGAAFGVENKETRGGGGGLPLNITDGEVITEGRKLESQSYGEINEDRDHGTQRQDTQTDRPSRREDPTHRNDLTHHGTKSPQTTFTSTETTNQRGVGRLRPTKEPNPDPQVLGRRRNNETPEEERRLKMEEKKLEEERKELLLLHKRLDQEKEILKQQQLRKEEEKRRKEKESQQHHLHHKQHHHLLTTLKTDTTTPTTTRPPVAPSGPRSPTRRNPPKRRMRKNRKRISKAAMRAMLM